MTEVTDNKDQIKLINDLRSAGNTVIYVNQANKHIFKDCCNQEIVYIDNKWELKEIK